MTPSDHSAQPNEDRVPSDQTPVGGARHDAHHGPADAIDMLAALYVAGALSAAEQRAFEVRIAAGDRVVLAALADLAPVLNALLHAPAATSPRASIRDALLRKITIESNASSSPSVSGTDEQCAGDRAERPSAPVWSAWDGDTEAHDALFTLHASDGAWEETGIDGIEVRRLFVDQDANRMTAMFRMAPGTEYVPHVHDGAEECYVLEGDLHVGEEIVMHAGDYQRAPAGSVHGRQWTEHGCVLLISSSLHDEQFYVN